MKWEISQIDDEDDLIPFSQKWNKPQLRCASIQCLSIAFVYLTCQQNQEYEVSSLFADRY